MKIEDFLYVIGNDFYTGVPDSLLSPLCDYLMDTYGIDKNHHIISANEGNSVAIAAGYNLSTGKIPVVYMQNSGEGNIVNPVTSLLHQKVYSIPMIFIIGWRGEPGVHDEPQHVFQGEITSGILSLLQIDYFVVSSETSVEELQNKMKEFNEILKEGKDVAFIVKKNALEYNSKPLYINNFFNSREEILEKITEYSKDDLIVSTTGKTSRELFEIRERNNITHKYDFLTVGSMGHCSSIALGVAINCPEKKVWCIDGDGACIMHMGAMATIGSVKPNNLIHIVINNESHESVGGLPTVSKNIDLCGIAKSCGYEYVESIDSLEKLKIILDKVTSEENKLTFLEIKAKIGSRKDLGRPTISAKENKDNFMQYIKELKEEKK